MATILALLPIAVITAMEGIPTRGTDVCDSCHGGQYDLVIEDPTISAPVDIDIGETDQVTVTALITADGTNSYWEFDAKVKLVSVNSKVTVSSEQSFSNQRPAVGTGTKTWTKDVTFDITGKTAGQDTLRAEVTMYPDHRSPQATRRVTDTITVINQAPSLSSGLVDPLSGDTSTRFKFSVDYSDPDGTDPSTVDLLIDGIRHSMTPDDGTADTIIEGETYSVTLTLDDSTHSFHFEASDGTDTTSFPASGEIVGPSVVRTNTAPNLTDPEVNPGSGSCNSTFSFLVTYTDPEGDPPSGGINLILGGMKVTPSMSTMEDGSLILRDGDHSNGERYFIDIPLECGTYEYGFNTSDGTFFSEIGPFTGPIVSESPVLVATIDEPVDMREFLSNGSIRFEGRFSSNKNVTDADFRWRSNITGFLGRGQEIEVDLPVGTHLISLNVSSFEWEIFSETEITVIVSDPPAITPVYITGHFPVGDVIVSETDTVSFNVTLNMDFVNSMDRVNWIMDGEVISTGDDEFTFSPGIDEEGDRILIFQILGSDGITILDSRAWNITVIELKAEILITESLEKELGDHYKRDVIEITLPVEDPFGRDLEITWTVDGITKEGQGYSLNLALKGGPWANEGDHTIEALVINPDGVEILIDFNYTLLPDPVIDDDDDQQVNDNTDDDDDEIPAEESEEEGRGLFSSVKSDRGAIIILVISVILILIGITKSVIALVNPANASPRSARDVVKWEE